MIYIVSGVPRSGTSMMMQALEAGGLPVVKSTERDAQFASTGYRMNPASLYEPSDIGEPGFPTNHEGFAVKVVMPIRNLAPGQYRVLVMRRDSEEIRQSHEAAFGMDIAHRGGMAIRVRSMDADQIDRAVAGGLRDLRARDDIVSLHEVWFDDVLADPVAELSGIDWPINVSLAARVVDPSLKRFGR